MKKVTTLDIVLNSIKSLGKSIEAVEFRITKSVNKGFQAIENRLDKIDKRFDGIDERIDNLEKRVHGTELGVNRIEMLHFKKIESIETDMLSFRTTLAKANILKSNASQK